MDENDPTFNNPALDLEDSDDDAEWNPLKDAEKSGKKRKHGHESSDEDEEDYSEFNNLHNFNKKRQQEAKRRRESSSDNHVPDSGEDFKVECLHYFRKCRISAVFVCCSYLQNISQVGTFLILKSDDAAVSASKPPALWRVDGKTLIQKYESIDGERRYKCVNTYSGWTANTRYGHRSIFVRNV